MFTIEIKKADIEIYYAGLTVDTYITADKTDQPKETLEKLENHFKGIKHHDGLRTRRYNPPEYRIGEHIVLRLKTKNKKHD